MDVQIKKGQERKIARAYKSKNRRGCKIVLHPSKCSRGCCTSGRLDLSSDQRQKLSLGGGGGQKTTDGSNDGGEIGVHFTHEDLHRNGTVAGGFIPLILAALASSVVGGLIERGIAGAGIVWKAGGGPKGDAYHLKTSSGNGFHIVPYKGKFAHESGAGLYLNPWPRGRGILPRAARPEDIRTVSPSQKKILRALASRAIHE